MSLSFQEKSLWTMLVSMVLVFSFYFSNAFSTAASNLLPHHLFLFAIAIVLLAFWVLAQLVEIVSQLWLYRRGV
jgi:hypothetical protein